MKALARLRILLAVAENTASRDAAREGFDRKDGVLM